jgi:leucyl aminopeptidase
MKIQCITKKLDEVKADFIVMPVFQGDSFELLKDVGLTHFFEINPDFGKLYESQAFYYKTGNYLLLGMGKKDKLSIGKIQDWAGAAVKELSSKAKKAVIILPETDYSPLQLSQAITIGAEVGFYNPSRAFKSEKKEPKLAEIEFLVKKADRGYQEGIRTGVVIAQAINTARNISDLPPNILNPDSFLQEVKKVAKELRLKLTVYSKEEAIKKGMGAFGAVALGSKNNSYMIVLEYQGDAQTKERWGLIGKGITFDTGGLYIKPAPFMDGMKHDCAGAATVLGAIQAIVQLNLKTNVVAVMAVTENSVGESAMRPGDIVTSYSGKTVEIRHTDAEGRLVLMDALTLAQRDYKATKLIDIATLTGAVIVALGPLYAGVHSNNNEFAQKLIDTGKEIGERYWQMPMDEEYGEMITSEIADLQNIGKKDREAGSITGAKLIEAAVEKDHPWIHIDTAGVADGGSTAFRSAGATGFGVKTLVDLLK